MLLEVNDWNTEYCYNKFNLIYYTFGSIFFFFIYIFFNSKETQNWLKNSVCIHVHALLKKRRMVKDYVLCNDYRQKYQMLGQRMSHFWRVLNDYKALLHTIIKWMNFSFKINITQIQIKFHHTVKHFLVKMVNMFNSHKYTEQNKF